MRKRITTITAIVVYSITISKVSQQPKALGVFLYTSGVKGCVVGVLNNIGISIGYKTIQGLINDIAKEQNNKLDKQAKDEHSIVIYNNFNRRRVKKYKGLGNTTK